MKCGRAKPAQNPFGEAIQNKINGRDPLPFTWSCTAKCDKGKGQYRATDDILQCKHEGISLKILFQHFGPKVGAKLTGFHY